MAPRMYLRRRELQPTNEGEKKQQKSPAGPQASDPKKQILWAKHDAATHSAPNRLKKHHVHYHPLDEKKGGKSLVYASEQGSSAFNDLALARLDKAKVVAPPLVNPDTTEFSSSATNNSTLDKNREEIGRSNTANGQDAGDVLPQDAPPVLPRTPAPGANMIATVSNAQGFDDSSTEAPVEKPLTPAPAQEGSVQDISLNSTENPIVPQDLGRTIAPKDVPSLGQQSALPTTVPESQPVPNIQPTHASPASQVPPTTTPPAAAAPETPSSSQMSEHDKLPHDGLPVTNHLSSSNNITNASSTPTKPQCNSLSCKSLAVLNDNPLLYVFLFMVVSLLCCWRCKCCPDRSRNRDTRGEYRAVGHMLDNTFDAEISDEDMFGDYGDSDEDDGGYDDGWSSAPKGSIELGAIGAEENGGLTLEEMNG